MSTAYVAPGPLTPILTNGWGEDRSWTLDSYRSRGGYQGLEKARTMEPADIVQAVKDSGLRGRGSLRGSGRSPASRNDPLPTRW